MGTREQARREHARAHGSHRIAGRVASHAHPEGGEEHLDALPEPLYALFGTGYIGYTAARAWGKAKGAER